MAGVYVDYTYKLIKGLDSIDRGLESSDAVSVYRADAADARIYCPISD